MASALKVGELEFDRQVLLDRVVQTLVGWSETVESAAKAKDSEGPQSAVLAAGHCQPTDGELRVITLDGRRGRGKTSLMLTLVEAWRSLKSGREDPVRRPRQIREGEDLPPEASWLPSTAEGGELLRDSFVLQGVDFDPHPEALSPYAQLISAVQPLVEGLGKAQGSCRPRRRGGCEDPEPEVSLRDELRHLVGRSIVGWDGGKATYQQTSPDDVAFNAQEHLDGWQRLKTDWPLFVNRLVTQLKQERWLQGRGLLIIPIDDVDMRLSAVRELLLAVRQLQHPRVVFLVSAFRNQAVAAVHATLLRDVGRAEEFPRAVRLDGGSEPDPARVAATTLSLAQAIVEKSLPPSTAFSVTGINRAAALQAMFSLAGRDDQISAVGLFGTPGALGAGTIDEGQLSYRIARELRAGTVDEGQLSYRTAREALQRAESLRVESRRVTHVALVDAALTCLEMLCALSEELHLGPVDPSAIRVVRTGKVVRLKGKLSVVAGPADLPVRLEAGLRYGSTEFLRANGSPADELFRASKAAVEDLRRHMGDPKVSEHVVDRTEQDEDDVAFTWAVWNGIANFDPETGTNDIDRVPWPIGLDLRNPELRRAPERHVGGPQGGLVPTEKQPALVSTWLTSSLGQFAGEAAQEQWFNLDGWPKQSQVDDVVEWLELCLKGLSKARGWTGAMALSVVFRFVSLIAAPEAGASPPIQSLLVRAMLDCPTAQDPDFWGGFSPAPTVWLSARSERVASMKRSLERANVRRDVRSLPPHFASSPMELALVRLRMGSAWWWKRPTFARFQEATDGQKVAVLDRLGVRTVGDDVPAHFVTFAFGEVLWMAEAYAVMEAVDRRAAFASSGGAPALLIELWRGWTEAFEATGLADCLSLDGRNRISLGGANRTHAHGVTWPAFVFIGGGTEGVRNVGGTLVRCVGEWRSEGIDEAMPRNLPRFVHALTALLLVATWVSDDERAGPGSISGWMIRRRDQELWWPEFLKPNEAERLRALVHAAVDLANEWGRGALADRAEQWLVLSTLAAASSIFRRETVFFDLARPAVPFPAGDQQVRDVQRQLLERGLWPLEGPEAPAVRRWFAHAMIVVPMMLDADGRRAWAEGLVEAFRVLPTDVVASVESSFLALVVAVGPTTPAGKQSLEELRKRVLAAEVTSTAWAQVEALPLRPVAGSSGLLDLVADGRLSMSTFEWLLGLKGQPTEVAKPLDINSAAAAELLGLSGIGQHLAATIVADREAKGPFRTVDDLARVSGIGRATVDRLRPLLVAR